MTLVLYLLVCLGAGLAVRLLRRWPQLAFAASLAGATALCALVFFIPSDVGDLFGRTLTLDYAARTLLWICTAATAALALFAPLSFEHSSNHPSAIVANSQGTFFFSSLAPFALALAVDSFPVAVFAWAIGLIVLMLSARPQNEGRVGGAAQFLLLVVIASACLLLSNRFFDLFPFTPENLDLARNTVVFLALGMGLLLSVAPLHIWLGPLADELSPLGMAYLVGVAQPVGVWLLVQRFREVSWLADKTPLLNVLLVGGIITVMTGAILAISERRYPRLIAYLSLIPLGAALIGLGLGTRLGLAGALLMVLNRSAGVVLLAGGMAFVRYRPERHGQRLGAFAILAGGLTLAGVAPMLGFAASMPIHLNLGTSNVTTLTLLVAASAAAIFAILRLVRNIPTNRETNGPSKEIGIVPIFCAVLIVGLVGIVFVLGLFPQVFVDPLMSTLSSIKYLK